MRKGGAPGSKKKVFALYVLQFERFNRSRNFMQNGASKGVPNQLALITLGPSGEILRILRRFEECEILMNYSVSKNRQQI